MIPVASPIPTPPNFTQNCATPGQKWVMAYPQSNRFPSHWIEFQSELADGFHDRCGWWAMYITDGQVDHYLSKKNYRNLAYDWDNYRYIAPVVNCYKGTHDDKVLDPFVVQPGWFEVLLPSMILIRTDKVPPALQPKADWTLKILKLDNGDKVRRNRRAWYENYKNGKITDSGLALYAPLVAESVTQWKNTKGSPLP